ncbi:uncharacterized protein BP01DRAFT_153935 [Aspergillus saccharolyticus JOP 1030-1]|uniref:Uncharacterized protein n=1 Tax=Aspergillus saccharolyticus JOP 1030-1 TaxID=1450539 RepID=A0A318ZM63_9EURO|nr:hypothetical protein BP01DRAFT_153935 [Aspergillus saccharolyticus JOP 1030-1]PYH48679.1 hypothetical protein BP01DRAFT_153935 [Aspergillus saccharolyticus JOP 1030-1]
MTIAAHHYHHQHHHHHHHHHYSRRGLCRRTPDEARRQLFIPPPTSRPQKNVWFRRSRATNSSPSTYRRLAECVKLTMLSKDVSSDRQTDLLRVPCWWYRQSITGSK